MALTPKTGRQRAEEEEELRLGWRMAGLAFIMSSEAAAGAVLGWLVDYFAHTGPKGLLFGAILGIAVGLLSFVRGAFTLNKMLARQEPRKIEPLPNEPDEGSRDADDWKT